MSGRPGTTVPAQRLSPPRYVVLRAKTEIALSLLDRLRLYALEEAVAGWAEAESESSNDQHVQIPVMSLAARERETHSSQSHAAPRSWVNPGSWLVWRGLAVLYHGQIHLRRSTVLEMIVRNLVLDTVSRGHKSRAVPLTGTHLQWVGSSTQTEQWSPSSDLS